MAKRPSLFLFSYLIFAFFNFTVVDSWHFSSLIGSKMTHSNRLLSTSSSAKNTMRLLLSADIISPFDPTAGFLDGHVDQVHFIYYYIVTCYDAATLFLFYSFAFELQSGVEEVLPLTRENVEKVLDEVRPHLQADG